MVQILFAPKSVLFGDSLNSLKKTGLSNERFQLNFSASDIPSGVACMVDSIQDLNIKHLCGNTQVILGLKFSIANF